MKRYWKNVLISIVSLSAVYYGARGLRLWMNYREQAQEIREHQKQESEKTSLVLLEHFMGSDQVPLRGFVLEKRAGYLKIRLSNGEVFEHSGSYSILPDSFFNNTTAETKPIAADLEPRTRQDAQRANDAERRFAIDQARQQAEEQTRRSLGMVDVERKKAPGILILTTMPTGALVTIDQEQPRKSPLTPTISPGKHRISISLIGYKTLETTAYVFEGETTDLGMIRLQEEP